MKKLPPKLATTWALAPGYRHCTWMVGGVMAWFAVGCPVCNKIALVAFGYSGAITYFAPIQPFLALGAMVLTAVDAKPSLPPAHHSQSACWRHRTANRLIASR